MQEIVSFNKTKLCSPLHAWPSNLSTTWVYNEHPVESPSTQNWSILKKREKSFIKWLIKAPGEAWYHDYPQKPTITTQPTNGSKCSHAHSRIPARHPEGAECVPVKKRAEETQSCCKRGFAASSNAPNLGRTWLIAWFLLCIHWDNYIGIMMGTV